MPYAPESARHRKIACLHYRQLNRSDPIAAGGCLLLSVHAHPAAIIVVISEPWTILGPFLGHSHDCDTTTGSAACPRSDIGVT